MDAARTLSLAVSVLAIAIAGCMEPGIYQGYGPTPPKEPPRRSVAPAPGSESAPQPGGVPGKLPPAGDPFWAHPGDMTGLGQAPDNVAIKIEKVDANTLNEMGLSLGGRYEDGRASVRLASSALMQRNGLQIGVASGSARLRAGASAASRRDSFRQQLFVTVLNGQEGMILVGDDVYVQRLGYWSPAGYQVLAERAFVGRALIVRPKILGNGAIQVELWPRFTTREGRAINLTELATTVVVRDGQPIVIGGMSAAGSDVASVLLATRSRTQTAAMAMILTAKVGGMGFDLPMGKW